MSIATALARMKATCPRAINRRNRNENQISLDLLDTDSSIANLASVKGYGGQSARFQQGNFQESAAYQHNS
jgi:hypothetical protein